jgi:hypothetical protein
LDDSDDSVTVGGAIRLDGDVLGLSVLFEVFEKLKVVHRDVSVKVIVYGWWYMQVFKS